MRLTPKLAIVPLIALLLAACGDSETVTCVDSSCPAGQVCGDSGCEPLGGTAMTGDLGRYTSTAQRADGRLVVATYDATHRNLVVALEQPDGSDEFHIVDGFRFEDGSLVDTDSGKWSAVAIDEHDVVHVVWFDVDTTALRYGRKGDDGDGWDVVTVDGSGPEIRGTHASMAVDQGTVHVAYRDESARRLRYARLGEGGSWRSEGVPGCASEAHCGDDNVAEDYGEFSQVAVIGGRPRIAFYDRARGDLKMATRSDGGGWETTTLDGRDPATGVDTADVGRFISLALTTKREIGLAYFDASRGALRLLAAGSEPMVVDDGVYWDEGTKAYKRHLVGQHVALRFDGQGRAVMLYLDAGSLALKQAIVSGGNVNLVRRVEGLAPGAFLSFDLMGAGQIHGAYGAWVDGEAPRTRLDRFLLRLAQP